MTYILMVIAARTCAVRRLVRRMHVSPKICPVSKENPNVNATTSAQQQCTATKNTN